LLIKEFWQLGQTSKQDFLAAIRLVLARTLHRLEQFRFGLPVPTFASKGLPHAWHSVKPIELLGL
jgi:hypothetical protein